MFKDKLSICDVIKPLIQLLIGLHPHLKLIYSNSPAVHRWVQVHMSLGCVYPLLRGGNGPSSRLIPPQVQRSLSDPFTACWLFVLTEKEAELSPLAAYKTLESGGKADGTMSVSHVRNKITVPGSDSQALAPPPGKMWSHGNVALLWHCCLIGNQRDSRLRRLNLATEQKFPNVGPPTALSNELRYPAS